MIHYHVLMTKIIPITDFIRKFGNYSDLLPQLEKIVLTREGRPFAELKATPEEKNRQLLELKGTWKGSLFANNHSWKEVNKRKNRKSPVKL